MHTAVFIVSVCALALLDLYFSSKKATQKFGQNSLVWMRRAIRILLFSSFIFHGVYSYYSATEEYSCKSEVGQEQGDPAQP